MRRVLAGRAVPLLLAVVVSLVVAGTALDLTTEAAPYGVLSLELAGSAEATARVVASFDAAGLSSRARLVQVLDAGFPWLYTAAGLAALARWGRGDLRWAGGILVAAGVLDGCVENPILDVALWAGTPPDPWPAVAAAAAAAKLAAFPLALAVAWGAGRAAPRA